MFCSTFVFLKQELTYVQLLLPLRLKLEYFMDSPSLTPYIMHVQLVWQTKWKIKMKNCGTTYYTISEYRIYIFG